jgi:hypothetical protein
VIPDLVKRSRVLQATARPSIIFEAKFNKSDKKNDRGDHQIVIPDIQIKGTGYSRLRCQIIDNL